MRVTYYATTLLFVLAVSQANAQLIPLQTCSLFTTTYVTTINTALGASATVMPGVLSPADALTLKTFIANFVWMANQPAYDAVHVGACAEMGKQAWKRVGYNTEFDVSNPGTAPNALHFNEIKKSGASSAKPASFLALASVGALAHLAGKF